MKRNGNDFKTAIDRIEAVIGYKFKDKSLITQAFTRTSYCNEHPGEGLQSNEVLEFFGDGVLSVAIISFLLREMVERDSRGIHTKLTEGDFSNIKSKLSDKKNLSGAMQHLGLAEHLRMGEGDAKLGIDSEPSVMEDLFESIIGAVYIDCKMDIPTVMTVVSRMLDVRAYTDSTPPIQSSKNALQEWCADKKRRLPQPLYKTVREDGPDHKKVYERGCYIGERLVATGIGKNMKLADAAAAEATLAILKKEAGKSRNNANNTLHKVEEKQAGKSEINSARVTASTPSAVSELKNHATAKKTATPTFKDLGEGKDPQGRFVYRVECLFMGYGAVGTGHTRAEAREAAAGMVKKQLAIGKSSRRSGR